MTAKYGNKNIWVGGILVGRLGLGETNLFLI